jgi:hypothetical protein
MTPCSPLSCTRRFGGTYHLHLQGRRISSAPACSLVCWTNRRVQLNGLHGVISQKMILFMTTAVKPSNHTKKFLLFLWNYRRAIPFRFWLNLFLPPWRWRRYVPPKRRLKLNGLNGVIFQKTLLLAGFGWTYFFHPEDGGDMFLRNVRFCPKEVATKFKNLRNSWTTQHHTLAPILSVRR